MPWLRPDKNQLAFHPSESAMEYFALFDSSTAGPYVTYCLPFSPSPSVSVNICVWEDAFKAVCLHSNAQHSQLSVSNNIVWKYSKHPLIHITITNALKLKKENKSPTDIKYPRYS